MINWVRRLLGVEFRPESLRAIEQTEQNPFVQAEEISPACKIGVAEALALSSLDGYWPGWPATPCPPGRSPFPATRRGRIAERAALYDALLELAGPEDWQLLALLNDMES